MDRNAWRIIVTAMWPARYQIPIFPSDSGALQFAYTVPPPCRRACAVPHSCNERLPTVQRRPGAGLKHKHKELSSMVPRRNKIRARWDTTDSENKESTSYIISFPDIHSSQDEFEEPSPIQYQHERTKKMLVHLLREPSSEKKSYYEVCDSIFPHL